MDEIWTRKRFANLYSVPYQMSPFLFRKLSQILRTIFDVTFWFGSKLFEFAVLLSGYEDHLLSVNVAVQIYR